MLPPIRPRPQPPGLGRWDSAVKLALRYALLTIPQLSYFQVLTCALMCYFLSVCGPHSGTERAVSGEGGEMQMKPQFRELSRQC